MSTLNERMAFDHVIEIKDDGSIVDRSDIYAPEITISSIGDDVPDGWELLTGWTGQYGYNGPHMHSSEFIGGGLEAHIRETPGVYVAVNPWDMDSDEPSDTWVIARKIA